MRRNAAFILGPSLMFAGSPLLGQTTVVPTDIQLPGTQPQEIPSLESVVKCDNCHSNYAPAVEPWFQWAGSAMAQATRDPLLWASLAVAEQDFPGAGDLCLRCHTPEGWISGRSTPTDGSALAASDAHGVSCDVCHQLTNPDQTEHLGVQIAPFLAHDEGVPKTGYYGSGMYVLWNGGSKLGPYSDPASPHPSLQSKFHRSAELCGTCHDVSNSAVGDLAPSNGAFLPLTPGTFSGVPGTPVTQKAAFNNFPFAYGVVERTFSEHQGSAFATLKVADYATLPAELKHGAIEDAWLAATAAAPGGNYADGTVRTFTCQTCHMPPVQGKGCNKQNAPVRTDLPKHDLTGGNYWLSDALQYLDAQGNLVIGGAIPDNEDAALVAGAERARDNLEAAARLEVSGNTLRVINLTGHKLITGYPEGRRMWLRVRWRDAMGALIREDGAYGPLAVMIDGLPAIVDTLLAPEDPHTRLYEANLGIRQDWAAKLVALGVSPALPLAYDRVSGAVTKTLGQLAADPPGSKLATFHFVLNDQVVKDTRIPPYGLRFDDAVTRNTLPVPETQYGSPGVGGVFAHYDEFDLDPPLNAATAKIELLYQPTSWEYVQFLELANVSADPFLATTGADLLDAWRHTGMAAPHLMATADWTMSGAGSWLDLGGGLAGTTGIPQLSGVGTLHPGDATTLALSGAVPLTPSYLVVGFTRIDAPFFGGVLFPAPDLVLGGLVADAVGAWSFTVPWPSGLPSGFSLWLQVLVPDSGALHGVALSNGVQATTP